METRRIILAATALVGTLTGVAAPAHAAAGIGFIPSALFGSSRIALQSAEIAQTLPVTTPAPSCAPVLQPAMGQLAAAHPAVASKAAAILGGQVSALELIAQQQATATVPQLARQDAAALPGASLQPGAGGPSCSSLVMPSTQLDRFQPGLSHSVLRSEDFLASHRLPINHTSFDRAWNRVRAENLPVKFSSQLRQAMASTEPRAMLQAVNSWTNAKIRYVEDRELFGQADYWASAGSTLKRGAGDCEDIAIAKMQLLAAMGVAKSDMYLVIARDLARNADHAVLVVKLGDAHWLLDNATDQLLDARDSYDYRPIMSFSTAQKWLHGY